MRTKAAAGMHDLGDLLKLRQGHVHLLGICGVGVAGLAFLLQRHGFTVSGCDAVRSDLADWLEVNGIEVCEGHDVAHLDRGVSWLVRSAAVPHDVAELERARELGLPVFDRGEVLPTLANVGPSVAVAGTHGKTTTAACLVQLLRASGRDPSWCIGGETPGLPGVSGVGVDDLMVVEADESDGSLVNYRPDIGIITNIESDHLEHFGEDDALDTCFGRFANQAGCVIFGDADSRAAAACFGHSRARGFGFGEGSEIRAGKIVETGCGTEWSLECEGDDLALHSSNIIGRHNISNALAAVAACLELGIPAEALRDGLNAMKLPRRRFDIVSDHTGVVVVNDYAHHPGEIAALIQAASTLPQKRLVAVFQPHRYSRTLALKDAFPPAFAGVDELLLLPVYAASEAPVNGGATWDLYESFRTGPGACTPMVAESLEEAWAYLRRSLREDDVLLVIGAGDVEQLAHTAKAALDAAGSVSRLRPGVKLDRLALSADSQVRFGERMDKKTTLQLGGPADIWIDVATVLDFQAILEWTHAEAIPLTLIAGGSNVLVSDLGVRGVTLKLLGPEFFLLEARDGLAIVGAAVPVNAMLDWMESMGMCGLEFMESIPGTLGGGMQMNAGAWGKCLGDQLAWIRCLDREGREFRVARDQLDLGYRRCAFLRDRYVVEAAFHVIPGDREAIAAERLDIRERRAWMAGHRSAGSYFKNPEGEKAGRLLEAVGMHDRRVGGAVIGTHHANFVIVENGATSADVRALTAYGWRAVAEQFDLGLEPEVKYLT